MTFLWPDQLWMALLLPVLLLIYLWLLQRRKKTTLRLANLTLAKQAAGKSISWRRHLPPTLLLLGFAALIIAAARPMAVVTLPTEQQTIILAMDVSISMRAADIAPYRISATGRRQAIRCSVATQCAHRRGGLWRYSAIGASANIQSRGRCRRD